MKLTIENLAKISKAEVELNGITVVAGYNSTGKSTISKALLSVMSAYSDLNEKIMSQRSFEIRHTLENTVSTEKPTTIYFGNRGGMGRLARALSENRSLELNVEKLRLSAEEGLMDEEKKQVNRYIQEHFEEICAEIEKKRDIPDREYASFIVNNQFRWVFDQQINTFGSEKACTIDLSAKEEIHLEIVNNKVVDLPLLTLKEATPFYIEPRHMLDMSARRYYTYQTDFSLYDDLSASESIAPENMTLEQYTQREHSTAIVKELADQVMHGSLRPTEEAVRFYDTDFQSAVSVKNTASGIKSMALIARLIENGKLAQRGMLIIDEPEVNLHPEWQLRFANFLVRLNKELDIQILLTTHSPYFLRAIEKYAQEWEVENGLKLYMTVPSREQENLYTLKDVTDTPNLIFKQLYLPLESL